MHNFLGTVQAMRPFAGDKFKVLPRVCAKGQCEDHEDAMKQLIALYIKEYPKYKRFITNEKFRTGGTFVFDCTPYELIEQAADEDSMAKIRTIYEEAVELAPLTI